MSRAWIIAGLALALVVSWLAIGLYHGVWEPLRRQKVLLRVAGLVYSRGPVLLVGDSILASITPPCADAINLAIPGAKAGDLDLAYAGALAAKGPSKIVVLIGVNDLRDGADPSSISSAIAMFLRRLHERLPTIPVTVLSILPIIENEISERTNNAEIQRANAMIRAAITGAHDGFVDVTGLFGGDTLAPNLTYDGLHLNGQGSAVLSNLLFDGIARPQPSPPRCAGP